MHRGSLLLSIDMLTVFLSVDKKRCLDNQAESFSPLVICQVLSLINLDFTGLEWSLKYLMPNNGSEAFEAQGQNRSRRNYKNHRDKAIYLSNTKIEASQTYHSEKRKQLTCETHASS